MALPVRDHRGARRWLRLVAVLAVAVAALLGAAGPASAHATLESTNPADGSVVATAPTQVSATFDEAVGVSDDSLRVFDPQGRRVDRGPTHTGTDPDTITTGLMAGVGQGTFTVAWHVVSADSHPVEGAFTFSIGVASATSVNTSKLTPAGSTVVGVLYGVVRGLAFGSFALLIGVVVFIAWCWPAGGRRVGATRLVTIAWATLTGASVVELFLQGVYGAGVGLGRFFSADLLRATLHSRLGQALETRLALLALVAVVLPFGLPHLALGSRRWRRWFAAAWLVVGLGFGATWASANHQSTGIQPPLAMAADMVHLTAMAVWVGGLAVLAVLVLRPRDLDVARKAVATFSPIALTCVAVMAVTGTYEAWRGVGTWPALVDTAYGRLVLLKIAGILLLIGLGYLARIRIAALALLHPADGAVAVPRAGWRSATSPAARCLRVVASLATGHAFAVRMAAKPTDIPPGRSVTVASAGPATSAADLATTQPSSQSPSQSSSGGTATATLTEEPPDTTTGTPPDDPATVAPPSDKPPPPHPGGGDDGGSDEPGADPRVRILRRLRWSVAIEAGVAAAILGVTSLLVNTQTGRESYHPTVDVSTAFDTGAANAAGTAEVEVSPARLGVDDIRIALRDRQGHPYDPESIDATLSLSARQLGPIEVPLRHTGPGRFEAPQARVTFLGHWTLALTIRADDFDETIVYLPVQIT